MSPLGVTEPPALPHRLGAKKAQAAAAAPLGPSMWTHTSLKLKTISAGEIRRVAGHKTISQRSSDRGMGSREPSTEDQEA